MEGKDRDGVNKNEMNGGKSQQKIGNLVSKSKSPLRDNKG